LRCNAPTQSEPMIDPSPQNLNLLTMPALGL
jgi:hypothetical protein